MKKAIPASLIPLLFAVLASGLCLAENLVKDGTMDTSTGWSGDRAFETVDGNRVLALEARSNRSATAVHNVRTSNSSVLCIKFRYRVAGYSGGGLQIHIDPGDLIQTFTTFDPTADGQWHDYDHRFRDLQGTSGVKFSFILLEGSGKVLIDDVVITTSPAED